MAKDYSLSVAAAMWRYAENCADKERRNTIMTTKTDITQAPASAEPIYQVFHTDGTWEDLDADSYANSEDAGREVRIVYAAPVAQGPVASKAQPVPQDPTDKMLDAAERLDWSNDDVRGNCCNMWYAMLAAAPVAAQAQTCNHVYEARPIDGTTRASVQCEPVCRKCGYRPAVRAAKGE